MLDSLSYWPRTYLFTGCTAFVLSALLMPLGIYALRKLNVLDHTAPNKIHTRAVPRGGGVIIFLAFAVAVLLPGYRSHGLNGVLIGAFICLAVGAFDDFVGGVSGVWKLLTLFLVTYILSRFGVQLKVFQYYPLDLAFTMLWLVGVTSAFNGLDNMDGLASGTATVVSAMFFVIALQSVLHAGTETSLSWFGLLAAGLIGANLGFLIYNFKPAKVFMGDAGSFSLGFTLAALGVMGQWAANPIIACTIPILILGVPIFDFAYILVARIVRGETRSLRAVIEHCAPDHLSHRLVWIGFSERQAVLVIYLLSIAMGVSGLLLRNSSRPLDSILGLLQGGAMVGVVVALMTASARKHARDAEALRSVHALASRHTQDTESSARAESAAQ